MNPLAIALAAWVFFGLELGLRDALRLGPTLIAPSFVFVLCALIAISAPPIAVLWACLILGLVTDLTNMVELAAGAPAATVIGPYALGYLLAGQLMLSLRALLMRANPPTLAFLSMVGYAVAQIVVVAIFTLRAWIGDPIEWHATTQLLQRLGAAAYTGVLGLVLSLVLVPLGPLLGLHSPQQRRFGRR